MGTVQDVRRKDWKIDLDLPHVENESDDAYDAMSVGLIDAIYVAKPSFVYPRLVLEVRQPVLGRIANGVIRMCRLGISRIKLRTLFPDQPALVDDEESSHIIYEYGDGRIIEQETVFCRDIIDGEELLTHTLVAMFEEFHIKTYEWGGETVEWPTLVINNTSVPSTGPVISILILVSSIAAACLPFMGDAIAIL